MRPNARVGQGIGEVAIVVPQDGRRGRAGRLGAGGNEGIVVLIDPTLVSAMRDSGRCPAAAIPAAPVLGEPRCLSLFAREGRSGGLNLDGFAGDYLGVDTVRRDALLVVQAQLGDRRSLAELVGHWHEPVWRYVRRMLDGPGVADDVSQEVWASALKALPGLREPQRFAPWLFTIARRSIMDRIKHRYRSEFALDSDLDRAVDDHVAGVLNRAQVLEGLSGLPVREREVLILFYLQDLSLEDCAQILEVPVGTVKSRLSRARQLLRDRLVDKGYCS
jgi:RNA polymerase sigma factor (sigma-70 family)